MRKLRNWVVAIVAGVLILVLLSGCPKPQDPWPEGSGLKVLASFAPLHCFALNVAGNDATVLPLMTERGPHHFSDSPQDVLKLKRAEIFLINGLELDNAVAKRMVRAGGNRDVRVFAAAESLPKEKLREGVCNCAKDGDDDHHDHAHGKYDPHVWLGIPEAIHMVEQINAAFKQEDPAHGDAYRQRTEDYVSRLKKLQVDGVEMLKTKKERKIVSFHDSLHYFCRTFDLTVVDSIEIAAGTEPGSKKLTDLVNLCQKENVRFIAVEPQYPSNTSAKTILTELRKMGIEAEFVEIDPLETAAAGDLTTDFYERKMRENLRNLADKLK
jgi:ABC-type Zn uptake system ZnuABC Zn-binding protein ZnuA